MSTITFSQGGQASVFRILAAIHVISSGGFNALTEQWAITKPSGSRVAPLYAQETPYFTPDVVGNYTVELQDKDGVVIDSASVLVVQATEEAQDRADTAPSYPDEFTNPIAASATLISASAATSTDATTRTALVTTFDPPRRLGVTCTSASGSYQGNATFVGKNVFGQAISEEVNVTDNTTTYTENFFASLTEDPAIDAQVDASGAISLGTGAGLGLRKPLKYRAGLPAVTKEFAAGSAAPTAGTFTTPAATPPCGGYTPNSAANGSRDYCIWYEVDKTIDHI